jgi:hypothetical protein
MLSVKSAACACKFAAPLLLRIFAPLWHTSGSGKKSVLCSIRRHLYFIFVVLTKDDQAAFVRH